MIGTGPAKRGRWGPGHYLVLVLDRGSRWEVIYR